MASEGPLVGVEVVDLTRDLGQYCGRLLHDLGASVTRVLRPGAASAADFDPVVAFRSIGIHHVERGGPGGPIRGDVEDLLSRADLLLTDEGPTALRSRGVHPDDTSADPFVHISISPFGLTGPDADAPATDLTVVAAGGLMTLAGDPDRPPIRPYGEQAGVAASLHGAIGGLIALRVLQEQGRGQLVDVSAQESIAQAIENAAQYLDCEGVVRRRGGAAPREAGGGLFRCADGYVYLLATMGGFDLSLGKVADWLEVKGVAEADELRSEDWASGSFRSTPAAIARFTDLFERYSLATSKLELYTEGQARNISIAPVSSPTDLLENPQLVARAFFDESTVADRSVLIPGAPYRFEHGGVGPGAVSGARVPPPRHRRGTAKWSADSARKGGPLDGIRVADFTWVGAGPFLTKPFGDHGADVIKVESRTRTDPIRSMRPFRDGVPGLERSGYFANRNSSKRSICLDLKDARGLDLARRLIACSDVVANNFSAGTMESLGLGYEDAKRLNPRVVFLDMPMQGTTGPHRAYRGYGLTIGAVSGFLDSTGWSDRPPVGTGTNFPDHVPNPLHGAIAVLAALHRRELTGEGEYIELSQLESTVNAIGPALLEVQLSGDDSVRRGNADLRWAPHGVYPARGHERWIAIAVRTDAEWRSLCTLLPDLPDRGSVTLDDAISAATAREDRDELVARLRAADVPAAAVNDADDLLVDRQLVARRHWVTLDHPVMGPSVYDAPPYRFSQTPGGLASPAPLLGADTRDVCIDLLGLSEQEWELWHEEGIIG